MERRSGNLEGNGIESDAKICPQVLQIGEFRVPDAELENFDCKPPDQPVSKFRLFLKRDIPGDKVQVPFRSSEEHHLLSLVIREDCLHPQRDGEDGEISSFGLHTYS